ncbi:hypothetical protein IFM89_030407 [Coptis chinensis]|uniref:Uncharacterized protein n=1 Tax=Coptis chinensis TaxID=261450 RepID=A0A835I0U6_9MAGN|nr:hypothetical protein IFM89_030407 [Coptis chinensis]
MISKTSLYECLQCTSVNFPLLSVKDGRMICSSIAAYGEGKEAGNEAGYIVGMSTCYPQPGSVKISDGEALVLESNYSSSQRHTGVMGLFYLMIAEQLPKNMLLSVPVKMLILEPMFTTSMLFANAGQLVHQVLFSIGSRRSSNNLSCGHWLSSKE